MKDREDRADHAEYPEKLGAGNGHVQRRAKEELEKVKSVEVVQFDRCSRIKKRSSPGIYEWSDAAVG